MHFKKVYNSAEVARGPGDALYCGMVYCMLLLGWCKLLPDGSRLEELCLFRCPSLGALTLPPSFPFHLSPFLFTFLLSSSNRDKGEGILEGRKERTISVPFTSPLQAVLLS